MEAQSRNKLGIKADIFKALGHPIRIGIMELLRENECAVSVMVDRFGCSMATVSKHLTVLKASGLVSHRKEGLNVYFRMAWPDVSKLVEQADAMISTSDKVTDSSFNR